MPELHPQAIFLIITVIILALNKVVELWKARSLSKEKKEIEWKDVPPAKSQPPVRSQTRTPPQRSKPAPQRQTRPQRTAPTGRQPAPAQQQQPRSPMQDVLADLFESAGIPVDRPEQKQTTSSRRTPPPIPGERPEKPKKLRKQPQLSKAEREALEQLEKKQSWGVPTKRMRNRAVSSGSSGSIGALLRSTDAARQSIVVAEILGPPRGLQDFEQRA